VARIVFERLTSRHLAAASGPPAPHRSAQRNHVRRLRGRESPRRFIA